MKTKNRKCAWFNRNLIGRIALIRRRNKQKNTQKIYNKCYCIQFSSIHIISSQFNVRNIYDKYFIHTTTLENTHKVNKKNENCKKKNLQQIANYYYQITIYHFHKIYQRYGVHIKWLISCERQHVMLDQNGSVCECVYLSPRSIIWCVVY